MQSETVAHRRLNAELDALYQEAVKQFGTGCLWNVRPSATPRGMKVIATQLRKYGNMDAWRLAGKITKELQHAAR